MSVSTKNVRYRIHESLQFFCNLSHFSSFPNLTLYFFKIACGISSNLRLLTAILISEPSGKGRHLFWLVFIDVSKT